MRFCETIRRKKVKKEMLHIKKHNISNNNNYKFLYTFSLRRVDQIERKKTKRENSSASVFLIIKSSKKGTQ